MYSTKMTLLAAAALAFVGTVSSLASPESCGVCASYNHSTCTTNGGCMWVPSTKSCQNGCSYTTEEQCGIAESSMGCHDQCIWLSGQFNVCRPKHNFHFDVCVAVDVSSTMSSAMDFTKDYVKRMLMYNFMLPGCDLDNPDSPGCPHIGIISFDHTARTLMPNLTSIAPHYLTNQDCCLGPDATLPRMPKDWQSTVDSLTVIPNNHKRHTVEGVQRCADLLYNTHGAEPRSLPVLVLVTDGVPVGPNRFGQSTSACDVNPVKIAHTYRKNGRDPSCEKFAYREVTQNTKLDQAGVRTMVVALRTDQWTDSHNKLSCLLRRNGMQVGMMIGITDERVSGTAAVRRTAENSRECLNADELKATWFGIGSVVSAAVVALVAVAVYIVRWRASKSFHVAVSTHDEEDEDVPVKQVGKQVSLQDSTYDSDIECTYRK